MHFSKLPTELDIKIASFIDTKPHLSALSQVSKYYRKVVAEPLLYESIFFDVRNRRANYQFLLTLLQRPDLALHVKSMTISAYSMTVNHSLEFFSFKGTTTDQKKQIWSLNSVISELVSSIMCNEPETDESIILQNCLLGGLYMPDISDNRDETVLALILCMVMNVETLDVCSRYYCERTLGQVLQFPWTNTGTQPLWRLKHMARCCCTGYLESMIVYPNMQTDTLRNGTAWSTPSLEMIKPMSMPKVPKLLALGFIKSLTIDDKFLSLDAKANSFTTPEAYFPSTLQKLSIVGVSLERIHEMVELPSNRTTAPENETSSFYHAMNTVTAKLPLKALEISLTMELKNNDEQDGVQILELNSGTMAALRCAADELDKAGFSLKVHRCPGLYDKEGEFQLLISAGFTDPVPKAVRRELRELDDEDDRMATLSM
ncbi:hypothetical protein FB567DRAFT_607444 [Paraphoma chrysanthemicola]|uniref:F-box domain-containing protein n=1 Tax=Paraphoma chrysanthemicola TaxID=798071 RepID=A0A8K0QZV7_9PLEO|nr:hypothetical protein FB567DRAFT_607444 [Paraphoma chrysanthemicola]